MVKNQRTEFGQIVSSLRTDLGLTQAQLAQKADIDLPIISQIERGVKKHCLPEQLVAIADALELTTFERKQFFLASTGVEVGEMVRPNLLHSASDTANAEKEIKKVKQVGDLLRVPAFVSDPYYDFVLANPGMMALFHVTDAYVQSLEPVPHAYNAIHLTFGSNPITRTRMERDWEVFALSTMRAFRELSLRYRARPYFQYLMSKFRNPAEYPFFERFWKMAASLEEDKEANWGFFGYVDSEYGRLTYMAQAVIMITAYGELHLTQYQPLDKHTAELFEGFAVKFGTQMIRFATWPEKKFPKSPAR